MLMTYTHSAMICIYGTALAGLIGLLLGSFLNVCATRWPEDESVIKPPSHCRSCNRTLAWWENVPLASWLALRGRCGSCRAWIGWRYPLVELAVGVLWALIAWQFFSDHPVAEFSNVTYSVDLVSSIAQMIFMWLLVALAVFDVENLWLPDRLIWSGIGLGLVAAITRATLEAFLEQGGGFEVLKHMIASTVVSNWFPNVVFSAAVVLVIRWIYLFIRDQEGIGMGDVKLMAMLGGWFCAIRLWLLALGIGIVFGAIISLLLLASPSVRANRINWKQKKLPFGAFICLGGIVCNLWGQPIIDAYMRWAGL
jgi:leader peptidase (prepilin peptidase)/N-methyltransferase